MRTFDPDDPLLTAYALGELEGEELRAIEALIARDPAAARHVESIRAAAAGFGEAFEREPAPQVEKIRAVEIEPARRTAFIPWLFYASTAAAACFFVVLVIRLADPAAPRDAGLAAEAEIAAPPAAIGTTVSVEEQEAGAAAVGEELRQAAPLQKEKDAALVGGAIARQEESPAAKRADATFGARDASAAMPAATAPPPAMAPLGEMKDAAKSARAKLSKDEDAVASGRLEPSTAPREGAEDVGEMRSFARPRTQLSASDTPELTRLAAAVGMDVLPRTVDTAALLAELGLRELQDERANELGNLAQTTLDKSPMPDPEAAVRRAVDGFARLVAERTPANDAAWDRVLADARYAAGEDPRRLEFVALVGKARELSQARNDR